MSAASAFEMIWNANCQPVATEKTLLINLKDLISLNCEDV